MKKIISFALIVFMLSAILAGCGNGEVKLKGAEAAKLLLTDERLNSQVLKNSGNIFDDGAEVFRSLADIARENLVKYTYAGQDMGGIVTLSANSSAPAIKLLSSNAGDDGSVLEIDGDIYKWSNFGDYSNSYDYFESMTKNITESAEIAAQLIDDIKKNVRVVDKWVDMSYEQYYLRVEENSETLFSRIDNFVDICKRWKNEEGLNVYELYIFGENSETRMVYIPGKKCEYTHRDGDFVHNFIAENTKGYWEILGINRVETHYNVSCMVIKDDICYDAFYDPKAGCFTLLKFISADKKNDILFYQNDAGEFELQLQAFNGIKHIQIEVSEENVFSVENQFEKDAQILYVEENGKKFYMTNGAKSAEVVLDNGTILKENDVYLDGKVIVGRSIVGVLNKEDVGKVYTSSLALRINAQSYEERIEVLTEFLEMTGLTCKYDMNYISAGIVRSYAELEQMVKYHQWNESGIATEEDIAKGYENLDAKYLEWQKLYETVKDEEVIDYSNKEIVELNIKFAPITAQTSASVKADGLKVTATDVTLSVEDTTLLVENEPYIINFALLGSASQGLIHIPLSNESTPVSYSGQKPFTITQSVSFDIPSALDNGEYTVVVYISTADGIRMSGYAVLTFTEIVPFEVGDANIVFKTSKGEDNKIKITYGRSTDVEVELTFEEESVSYAEMYETLSKEAYTYGFAADGAMVEILGSDGKWTALSGDEEVLSNGDYRLKYEISNGESSSQGYVYTKYEK